jgi:beta-N-acetylhexosaminidase
LEQLEFVPFRAAMKANIAAIMSAHVVFEAIDPHVPGTLSAKVITGLLRGTLGFDGLILTDDLEMKAVADRFEIGDAAVRAVEAGCDILLVCKNLPVQIQAIDGLSRAIASGRISQDRLAQSRRRLELVLNTHAKM